MSEKSSQEPTGRSTVPNGEENEWALAWAEMALDRAAKGAWVNESTFVERGDLDLALLEAFTEVLQGQRVLVEYVNESGSAPRWLTDLVGVNVAYGTSILPYEACSALAPVFTVAQALKAKAGHDFRPLSQASMQHVLRTPTPSFPGHAPLRGLVAYLANDARKHFETSVLRTPSIEVGGAESDWKPIFPAPLTGTVLSEQAAAAPDGRMYSKRRLWIAAGWAGLTGTCAGLALGLYIGTATPDTPSRTGSQLSNAYGVAESGRVGVLATFTTGDGGDAVVSAFPVGGGKFAPGALSGRLMASRPGRLSEQIGLANVETDADGNQRVQFQFPCGWLAQYTEPGTAVNFELLAFPPQSLDPAQGLQPPVLDRGLVSPLLGASRECS